MSRIVPDGPAGRERAIQILRGGGVVAIPTDTVYGIAAAMDVPGAIERLFAVKDRPADRAIAVLLADLAQASELGVVTPAARLLGDAFWPGGLTLVIGQRPDRPLPPELTGNRPTIGVRVPDHDAPRTLARALGPLPTTSANLSGEPELPDAQAIDARLGDRLDLILDGGPARGGPASTVVDVSGEAARVLRPGAIPTQDVEWRLRDMGR
ncbi:MAG TPA: L-threonylcarbamoyladenylate synthase [Candidatus Limnocylindrales bacterium]|jgi:L-threonylcarbamoyladenylate synthase